MNIPPYMEWDKQYRLYRSQGIDLLIAWHMTNKHFGMNGDEWKQFEKEITAIEKQHEKPI